MNYSFTKKLSQSLPEALEAVKAALAEEGFGVLTEIDVAGTLKKKLDVDRAPYVILGACNPTLAHEALQAEGQIGLFLPCNVIVYEKEGQTHVAVIRPTVAMDMIENEALAAVAKQAEEKLQAVIETHLT